jgi:hypothetical protein
MKLSRRLILLGVAGAVIGPSRPGAARQGPGSYNWDWVLTLTGPVLSVYRGNSRSSLQMKANGKTWTCMLPPSARLTARGLPSGSIKVGDTVTVVGFESRLLDDEMQVQRIIVRGKTHVVL